MTVKGSDGKTLCNRGELAIWLGITSQGLQPHIDAGRFPKVGAAYDLRGSVQSYCAWQRETASGRGGADQVATLTEERARLASAQADAVEMKNAITRGETLMAKDVEREWSDLLRGVRSRILAVPSRVRARLGHIGAMEANVIDRELRDALDELGQDESETDAA